MNEGIVDAMKSTKMKTEKKEKNKLIDEFIVKWDCSSIHSFLSFHIIAHHKMSKSCKFIWNYDYYHTAPAIKYDCECKTTRKSWNYFCSQLKLLRLFDKDHSSRLAEWNFILKGAACTISQSACETNHSQYINQWQ